MEYNFRKQFLLPAEDIEFLDCNSFQWEAIANEGNWLIIRDYPIPKGYNVRSADIALMIPPNYPAAQIDMAYFYPHLQKTNGKGVTATSSQIIDDKNFQRWSRHREAGEWRPGEDNVMTHLLLANNWLEKDLKR
jgi:hypothetical protein